MDVHAEIETGFQTLAGVEVTELSLGTWDDNVTGAFYRDGDGVVEDTTNESILVWEEMRGYDFELTENTGVHHYDMLADAELLTRLLSHLQ